MAEPYSYRPLKGTATTRILHLHPSKDHESPLVCHLEELSLADATTQNDYKALSYVWGTIEGSARLWCSGKWINITKNCEAALRHLRHKKHHVALWVDAVCINQAVMAEKAVQIPLMGPIYRQAGCVVVWLGVGTRNTHRCFSRLKLWKATNKMGLAGSSRLTRGPLFRNLTGNMDVDEYHYLIENEWPKRGWTIQEVLLAAKVKVMCGEATASWEDFYEFVRTSASTMLELDLVDPSVAQTWDHPWDNRDEIQLHLKLYKAMLESPGYEVDDKVSMLVLIGLVTASHLSKTSDPKDRVYSLYGLLTTMFSNLPKVDYTRRKEDIYTDFTRATIMSTGSFWPALFDMGMIDASAALPCWVPSLDHCVECSDTTLLANSRYFANFKRQHARSDNRLPMIQSDDDRILTTRGSRLAVVSDTGLRYPQADTGDDDLMFYIVLTVLAWYHFFLKVTNQENLFDITDKTPQGLLDLLCQGEMQEDEDRLKQAFPSMMQWLLNHGDPVSWTNLGYQIGQDRKKVFFFCRPNLLNSIIFKGGNGCMGTTTGLIKKGDAIVLLTCCEVPVILRPRGDQWQYVGPAYIVGMMDSTLWPTDEKDLVNFSLI